MLEPLTPPAPISRTLFRGPGVLGVLWVSMLVGFSMVGTGCSAIGALAGAYDRTGTKDVEPEYSGLEGKSFAVVVRAGQMIQADYPEVVVKLTLDLSERLARESGASGYVPAPRVIDYLYNHPRWVAMPLDELGRQLGVQRLVYVEMNEYRLQDPGNSYLWSGVCGAMVGVIEVDGIAPEEFVYRKQLRLVFPDKSGFGPGDIPRSAVNTELVRRTVDRSAWLFYEHTEPNYPDY
ncbi:MAG: hypothetical protein ACT4PL_08990 [Phycisphaerales bacterium]